MRATLYLHFTGQAKLMEVVTDLFFGEKYCFYRNAAAVLGTLFVGRLLLRELCDFVSGFTAFFLAPLGIGGLNLTKYGSWAVVTGASEGIGRSYALELAKRGLNVVLMSRSEEKLSKVATEIHEKYHRETRIVPIDLSGGFEIYAPLADQLNELDIGVLINNVGFATAYPDTVGNIPAQRLYQIVQINCQPAVQMCRMMLPKMAAKGGGVVVNISSVASMRALPCMSVYNATKVFVNYLSDGIRKEYASKGIVVQNVTPCVVATVMTGIKRPSYVAPSPDTFAKAAVATIGVQDNTYGCFSHAMQAYVFRRLPGHLLDMGMAKGAPKMREEYFLRQEKSKTN